jgi:hypothetical protein
MLHLSLEFQLQELVGLVSNFVSMDDGEQWRD